jgi:hypothetical protein
MITAVERWKSSHSIGNSSIQVQFSRFIARNAPSKRNFHQISFIDCGKFEQSLQSVLKSCDHIKSSKKLRRILQVNPNFPFLFS